MSTTTDATTVEETPVFEKGTWQHDLQQSTALLDRAGKAKTRATSLIWTGAKTGINEWLPKSATDVGAEGFGSEVTAALGKSQKGTASKIKTVALAVREHSLDMDAFDSLSKAYAEARRLTQQVQQDAEDDDAAEKAIESIEVPKSTTTIEGAAAILLGKGVDGAVVAILDALGADNEAAHRSFMRAVATEISARVKAKADAEAAKKKEARDKAAADRAAVAAKKAESKKTAANAPKKATTKGKPVKKATSKATAKAPVESASEGTEAPAQAKKTPVKRPATKGKPIRRPAR